MPFEIGTHVFIQSRAAIVHGITGPHGLTGTIDEVDENQASYHVVFDTPRDGVGSLWFEESTLLPAPRYIHNCSHCEYLGQYDYNVVTEEYYDLYWCPQGNTPTVVARYGDTGPEYLSGMPLRKAFVEQYPDFPTNEAYRRAKERGYEVGYLS